MAQPQRKEKSETPRKSPQEELLALLDETIGLVPVSDTEIAILRRYRSEEWKDRLSQVHDNLLRLRAQMTESLGGNRTEDRCPTSDL